jgi:hypothetical protein
MHKSMCILWLPINCQRTTFPFGTRDNGTARGPIPGFWKDERASSKDDHDERAVIRTRSGK